MSTLDIQDSHELNRDLVLNSVQGSSFWQGGFDSHLFRKEYFKMDTIPQPDLAKTLAAAKAEIINDNPGRNYNRVLLHSLPLLSKLASNKIRYYPTWLGLSFFDLVHDSLAVIPACLKAFDPDKGSWDQLLSKAAYRAMDKAIIIAKNQGYTKTNKYRIMASDLNAIRPRWWKLDHDKVAALYNAAYPDKPTMTAADILFLKWLPNHEWQRADISDIVGVNSSGIDPAAAWHLSLLHDLIADILPEPCYTVFLLSEKGYSHTEIGAMFDKDRHWARKRLDKAIRLLKGSNELQGFRDDPSGLY